MKQRLDQFVAARGMVLSRSQGESWIRLGKVLVNGQVVTKPGYFVSDTDEVEMKVVDQYVSRAALKLASVATVLHLEFADKVMLDVGSSTGGFTDYALRHGARKVIAVEVGTDQLHPTLHGHERIELHEQTDIRQVQLTSALRVLSPHSSPTVLTTLRSAGVPQAAPPAQPAVLISDTPDLVVIDVSFISLREVLPHIAMLCGPKTIVAAMVKPQFEAVASNLKHKGVIKNDRMRRDILKSFEDWVKQYYVVIDKADSDIAGSKGNVERFYKLQKA